MFAIFVLLIYNDDDLTRKTYSKYVENTKTFTVVLMVWQNGTLSIIIYTIIMLLCIYDTVGMYLVTGIVLLATYIYIYIYIYAQT